jgi:1-phosphatidylinositol-4-phosphate 5-kinase
MKQLEVDCELLTSLNMMDYSLLVGIFDKSRVDPTYGIDDNTLREILAQDNCLHFTDRLDEQGLIYFMGIIDFLQHYNANKKFETVAKSFVNNRKEISSVKPRFYAKRLVTFIAKFVD